jgi:hypothetical protein
LNELALQAPTSKAVTERPFVTCSARLVQFAERKTSHTHIYTQISPLLSLSLSSLNAEILAEQRFDMLGKYKRGKIKSFDSKKLYVV